MFASRVISPSLPTCSHTISRPFSATPRQNVDFTHAIIGGGVIGLAIAQKLQARDGASTVLLEQHPAVGTETSSRNSEVIHAGLYYGASSLKTKLCIQGKHALYALCKKHNIPHRTTGKWIVAQTPAQLSALESLHAHAKNLGVPTRFLSHAEASRREPHVRATAGVLESPSTGILDSHALLQHLEAAYLNAGGLLALRTRATHIQPLPHAWEIRTVSPASPPSTITSATLINAAGLHALDLSNPLLPPARRITPAFAKGTYFSYAAPAPRVGTLVYPAPVPGHAGLGTHLTLDMAGRMRFGPDVEWVASPEDYTPNPDPARLAAALEDIAAYLPGVRRDAVSVDYCGIRPKLGRAAASGQGFRDFYIRKEEGFEGWVNLLGMESPGLTSCLAVADEVERLLYR